MIDLNLLNELKSKIDLLVDPNVIKKHSSNQFYTTGYSPDAVFYPKNENDVLTITQFCIEHKIPIIPYGSGTSVEGHLAAIHGGICIDFSKMKKIIDFKPDDNLVIVEPGISYNELNDFLEKYDYNFPVEAGWGASIGGMVSTNASGAGAVDSGSMSKNVFSLKVSVYDQDYNPRIISTGSKSIKSSSGYNLTSLFVGSEGTLGLITQIILKIRKNFEANNTISCQFENLEDAIKFVIEMKRQVNFRKVELLDKLQTNACINYSKEKNLDLEMNTVLIELAGKKEIVNIERKAILEALGNHNAKNITIFQNKEDAVNIWKMRKNACPAAIQYIDSSKKAMATDISVPLSELADCIQSCYKYMQTNFLKAPRIPYWGW